MNEPQWFCRDTQRLGMLAASLMASLKWLVRLTGKFILVSVQKCPVARFCLARSQLPSCCEAAKATQ